MQIELKRNPHCVVAGILSMKYVSETDLVWLAGWPNTILSVSENTQCTVPESVRRFAVGSDTNKWSISSR